MRVVSLHPVFVRASLLNNRAHARASRVLADRQRHRNRIGRRADPGLRSRGIQTPCGAGQRNKHDRDLRAIDRSFVREWRIRRTPHPGFNDPAGSVSV